MPIPHLDLSGSSQNSSVFFALDFIGRLRPRSWIGLDIPPEAAKKIREDLGVDDLIARHYWRYDFHEEEVRADMNKGIHPRAAAQEFVDSCKREGWWPYATSVMTPPAMAVATSPADLLQWAIEFQGWVHVLLYDEGRQAIVCNVPEGNHGYYVPAPEPDLPEATHYGCQEYRWIPGGSSWLGYREWFPQKVLAQNPNAALHLLEYGFTAVKAEPRFIPSLDAPHGDDVGFRGGYGVPAIDPDQILSELAWYIHQVFNDPYVVAMYWYMFGGNWDWATHDGIDSILESFMISTKQSLLEEDITMPADNPFRSDIADELWLHLNWSAVKEWLIADQGAQVKLWMAFTGQSDPSIAELFDLIESKRGGLNTEWSQLAARIRPFLASG